MNNSIHRLEIWQTVKQTAIQQITFIPAFNLFYTCTFYYIILLTYEKCKPQNALANALQDIISITINHHPTVKYPDSTMTLGQRWLLRWLSIGCQPWASVRLSSLRNTHFRFNHLFETLTTITVNLEIFSHQVHGVQHLKKVFTFVMEHLFKKVDYLHTNICMPIVYTILVYQLNIHYYANLKGQ